MAQLGRAEVVEAIRAWVAEHGGVPGRRMFQSRHDVPRTAFEGMYWPSWSEAVREAGFQPHEPNSALDGDAVMASYVSLIRRLGRMPSHAELRYEKKVDPDFPSQSVIVRRFGSRNQQRLDAVRAWCVARTDVADVLAMLPPPAMIEPAIHAEAAPAQSDGYVYMLQSNGMYKIGMTYSVPRRWAEIAGAAPDAVDLIHYFRTDDATGIELYWHRRFGHLRRGGEWFALTATEVRAFKRRTKFM